MNPFEMVVAIIIVVTIGQVIKARYGIRRDKHGNEFVAETNAVTDAENRQLRAELAQMKERLAVLERLATDQNSGPALLDREIEKLRDLP